MVKGLGRWHLPTPRHLKGDYLDMTRCPFCRKEQKPPREEGDECVRFKCGGFVVKIENKLIWTHEDVVRYDECFNVYDRSPTRDNRIMTDGDHNLELEENWDPEE